MKSACCILAAMTLVATPALAQPMSTQGNRPVMLIANDLDPCSLGQIAETGLHGSRSFAISMTGR